MNGKGDRNRVTNISAYEKNYSKIFAKEEKEEPVENIKKPIKRLKKTNP